MQVKQLAQRNKINADTIRHYTRIGLLTPSINPVNGYKKYTLEDEQRLLFIVQAKSLGFLLNDIKVIIEQSAQGKSPCKKVRELMQLRLDEIEAKIAAMNSTYSKMRNAMNSWRKLPNCTPTGNHVCHLIEKFDDKGETHV